MPRYKYAYRYTLVLEAQEWIDMSTYELDAVGAKPAPMTGAIVRLPVHDVATGSAGVD